MPRARYYNQAITHEGLPVHIIPNATITLYEAGTTDPLAQTIYAGPTGGVTLPNPFTTDADANVLFYLDAAQDVKIVVTGVGTGTLVSDYEPVWPSAASLVSRDLVVDDTDYALDIQNLDPSSKGLRVRNDAGGDVIKTGKGATTGKDSIVIGETGGAFHDGPLLWCNYVFDDHGVAFEFSSSIPVNGADSGTSRFLNTISNTGATSNGRAVEAHTFRLPGASVGDTWIIEAGLHLGASSYSANPLLNSGIRLSSDTVIWNPPMTDGARAGAALSVLGEKGWDYLYYYLHTDGASLRGSLDQNGKIKAGHVVPLAADTYTLGTSSDRWLAVAADILGTTAASGTPSAPNFVRVGGAGTAGLYIPVGDASVGLTIGASDYTVLSSAGLEIQKALVEKEMATPTAPAATYQKIFASTDGRAYRQTSAGTLYVMGSHTEAAYRRQFLGQLLPILGTAVRIWLPTSTDTTTSTDETLNGATITHSATLAGRLTAQGVGYRVTMNGASHYSSMPDAADLSFGNGTTDSAFSLLVLANVTDTAANRCLIGKWNTGQFEWGLFVTSSDTLAFYVYDNSVPAAPSRISNAAITQGALTLFGATYSASPGGASAASSMTLYQNGIALASTPTNAGTYVAMENLAAVAEIGASLAHTTDFLPGTIAMAIVCQKNMTAAEHWAVYQAVRGYFHV